MIKGKSQEPYDEEKALTVENIFKHISEFDVYTFYAPKFRLGEDICSPLRRDRKPSFVIKQSKKTGRVHHIDLAHPEYNGHALDFVQQLFGITFYEALQKISNDFYLGLGSTKADKVKTWNIISKYEQPISDFIPSYSRIDVFPRSLNHEEIEYWNKRFLSVEEVKKGEAYAIKNLYLDGTRITNPSNELRFAFYFPEIDRWKIYYPNRKKDGKEKRKKWMSNVPFSYIEGLKDIKKNKPCIGIKSRKDRLILKKFLPEVFEVQGENEMAISPEDINYIKENSSDCFLFFDNDATGVRACTYYNQFGLKYINLSKGGPKDPDELVVQNNSLDQLEKILKDKNII